MAESSQTKPQSQLSFVKKKEELTLDPEDLECPICLEGIKDDEVKNGVPNCILCENGHRCHRECYFMQTKRECPICKNTNMHNCKSILGYAYVPRKGGKKRMSRKYQKKTNKSKKKLYKCKRKSYRHIK